MNLDLGTIINTIISILRPLAIEKLKREETVIKILKNLNLDPTHTPADFDAIYAYTLVNYAVDKNIKDHFERTEVILELFRKS